MHQTQDYENHMLIAQDYDTTSQNPKTMTQRPKQSEQTTTLPNYHKQNQTTRSEQTRTTDSSRIKYLTMLKISNETKTTTTTHQETKHLRTPDTGITLTSTRNWNPLMVKTNNNRRTQSVIMLGSQCLTAHKGMEQRTTQKTKGKTHSPLHPTSLNHTPIN